MNRDDKLDRGTRLLVDDLLLKPLCFGQSELLRKARKYHYHDYKSDDALCSVTLVAHLKDAGYHDLAQNAADGKYDQQKDASDEWAQTPEGREMEKLAQDPEVRKGLDAFMEEAKKMPRYVVPDDGPPEPGTKGEA